MFFAFLDECYRILKPGGWLFFVVPSGRSDRAFMDPTHRRFFMQASFLCYPWEDWRVSQGLNHYRLACNFMGDVSLTMDARESLRVQEVQAERVQTLWNVTINLVGKLEKKPRLTEVAKNAIKAQMAANQAAQVAQAAAAAEAASSGSASASKT